jgi:hypothetical protein
MKYYTFENKEEALFAEQQIVQNIKNWVLINLPEAVTEDQLGLKSKNAKTGEWDNNAVTLSWDTPTQKSDGKWFFLKPTQEKTSPIPIEVVLNNVNALEEDLDSNLL